MIKKFIFIIVALLPIRAFCQITDNSAAGIAIGFIFSPDYCYRTLKPDAIDKWIADNRDSMEIPKFGFTTGASLLYKVSEHFTFETGLQYSDKGEKTKWFSDFIYNTPDPSIPTRIKYIVHYYYLDIPVKVNYYLLTKRLKYFISGGVSANIFLGQTTTSIGEFSDGHTEERPSSHGLSAASTINIAIIAGMGIQYSLNEKLSLRIEPTYRRSLTAFVNAPIKGYLYSTGVNLALYYKLR